MSSTLEEARSSIAGLWRDPRKAGLWLLFLAAYAALDRASALFQPGVGALTPWDLAGGLAFGFLILEGPGAAILVVLADFADDFLAPQSLPPLHNLVLAALATGVSYGLAAVWLRSRGVTQLNGQRDLLRLTIAAALAAAVHVAADFLLLGRWGFAGGGSWRAILPPAWIGAFVGILIVAPMMILPRPITRGLTRRTFVEAGLMGAALAAVMAMSFPGQPEDRFRFFYILFLPQIWVAIRFGVQGAVLGNFAVQLGLAIFFLSGEGPRDMIFAYQFRVLALAGTILILGCAVTERRSFEAALRQRQEELARISRLSLAGEMAAALAHQLNQPLMAAMAFARSAQRLARAEGSQGEEVSQAIDEAVAQTERAGSIVRSLREFIGRSKPTRTAISFERLLRQTAHLVEPECARAGAKTVLVLDHDLPDVFIDAAQIQQVLINLVHNAVDAMAGLPGRRVIILTARVSGAGELEAEVTDSGPGVPTEIEARLFEPFATDKPRGMGLGLTVCRGLVEAQGGRLWLAENLPGRCSFRFTLPLAKAWSRTRTAR